MTTDQAPAGPPAACPYSAEPQVSELTGLLPIHGPAFSANPHATYDKLREQGPIVPVEIDSTGVRGYLTTTYQAALDLLRNTPDLFSKDPSHWRAFMEGEVSPKAPALGLMQPRPNAMWMDGMPHARLRKNITDSLQLVDTHALAAGVTRIADALIDDVAARGEFDLVTEFADPLPMQVLMDLFGCPPDLGAHITKSILQLVNATGDATEVNSEILRGCRELARMKRAEPGHDITTWMLGHEAELTDEEMAQQLLLLLAGGNTPTSALIVTAVLRIVEDERPVGTVYDGHDVGDALDEILWQEPPITNYCPLYAYQPFAYGGVTIEPGVPILVSFAAANADPAVSSARRSLAGNRAHLAFSAGPHGCPAETVARVMTETAVERVLDRLPDLRLDCPAEELEHRPGTFRAGYARLPVAFSPAAASTTPAPPVGGNS
jgi:cytochrome P450